MPSLKTKTEPSSTKKQSISAIRQQIRRKLVQVGLEWQAEPKKAQPSKAAKQKSKQSAQQSENLPILKSHRNKNLKISQFSNVFSQNLRDLESHRLGLRKFSSVRGRLSNESVNSFRELSPCSIKKQPLSLKVGDGGQQIQQNVPWLKRFQLFKGSKNSQGEPMSIIRLFETKHKKEQYKEDAVGKRSKTEERQPCAERSGLRLNDTKGREITPWDFEIVRDTKIYFK